MQIKFSKFDGETADSMSRIEGCRSNLRNETIKHGAPGFFVAVCDAEDGFVIGATAHVDEGVIDRVLGVGQVLAAEDNGGHHPVTIKRCRIGRAGQVQVQAPKLVRRKATTLGGEISVVSPGCSARVRAVERISIGKCRIGVVR